MPPRSPPPTSSCHQPLTLLPVTTVVFVPVVCCFQNSMGVGWFNLGLWLLS